ncbi:MAG: cofactor-independent phosphoglycerate mutase [Candidatus Omnitrophica bacterium]|nr:cofactor-independent phosphoglycerate mutase [Candidatus Omnitrophota bacterium]
MKYIVIVPDGMTDLPISSLGGKTPLQAARTTNMDHMASNGICGMIQTIPQGMQPGSDVGNMSLMGYDPVEYHPGRAPLEAASMNIKLMPDEIAFRCNLITMSDHIMKDYSAGHIKNKEATVLIEALSNGIDLPYGKFYAGKSYRHLLVLKVRDPEAFCNIETVPPHDILEKDIRDYAPKGIHSEVLISIMERAYAILHKHPVNDVRIDLKENPANMIWLWGQGMKPQLPNFKDKYGLTGGVISAVDLVRGIGKLAGLEVIEVPGINGYYDTNYLGKAEYAINALKNNDFVFIHIEAPDEAGHNGDIENKILSLERIDQEVIGTILNRVDMHDTRILVVADHPTPVEVRTHTSEPVNFLMYGKGIEPNGAVNFSEISCTERNFKFANGEEMINFFIKKHLD